MEIAEEDYEFDRTEKSLAAYQKVTKEQVISHFHNLFMDNPRRVNVKIYSHDSLNNGEERTQNHYLNLEFYKQHKATFENIENPKAFLLQNAQFPRLWPLKC